MQETDGDPEYRGIMRTNKNLERDKYREKIKRKEENNNNNNNNNNNVKV